jgi:hypothetical protein
LTHLDSYDNILSVFCIAACDADVPEEAPLYSWERKGFRWWYERNFAGITLGDLGPVVTILVVFLAFTVLFIGTAVVAETKYGIDVHAMFTTRGRAPQTDPPLVGVGLPPDTRSPEQKVAELALDRRDTAEIMAEHPEHYRCRSYPDHPTMAEARPTGNVLVIIQYMNGRYRVTHRDGRVRITQKDVMYLPDGTHPTRYLRSNFMWTYRDGVAHFGVFVQNWVDGAPNHWSVPKITPGGPGLSLDATAGADRPTVIIIASDERSCYPSNNERVLPPAMWEELATVGLLQP